MNKEAATSSTPQLLKFPLLPKNCVGIVGNTPVILGKQLFIMDPKQNTSGDLTKIKTPTSVTKLYLPKARKSTCIRGTKAFPIDVSDDTPPVVTRPSSSGYEASSLIKALSSTSSMESKKGVAKLSGAETNISNQPSPLQRRHVPKNFTVSLLRNKDSTSESAVASHASVNQLNNYILKNKSVSKLETFSPQPATGLKTSKVLSFSSPKSMNASKVHFVEENYQSTPREKPSGSIVVNLNGQSVRIVGIPSTFAQSSSQKQQRKPDTIQMPSKSVQSHSVYDKKIKALKEPTLVFKKPSSSVLNKLPTSHSSTICLSQIPSSSSKGQNKSMIIGNIASLTTQSPSPILNTTQLVGTPTCGVTTQANIKTVNISKTPVLIPVPMSSVNRKPTSIMPSSSESEPYSALKTFLKSSPAPITSKPLYVDPLLQSSVVSSSHQISPHVAFTENISPSVDGDSSNAHATQKDMLTSQRFQYYTSLETFQEGKTVMVVKPVLDSSEDESDSVSLSSQNPTVTDLLTNRKPIIQRMTTPQLHASVKDSNTQTALTTTDDVKNKVSFNPQIQSVFSLATTSSEDDAKETKITTSSELEKADDNIDIINVDDEDEEDNDEEIQFNIHDKSWKEKCPPTYVVLERLHPKNIGDIDMENQNTHVQCSPHCRQRTLAYLCDLNLMPCEKRPIIIDSASDRKLDQSSNITIDVDKSNENCQPNKEEEAQKLASFDYDIDKRPEDQKDEVNNKPNCEPEIITKETNRKVETTSKECEKETRVTLQSDPACQILNDSQSPAQEKNQEPSVSTKEVYNNFNKANEKESTQFQHNLMSLKRQIDEKRLKMQHQKKDRTSLLKLKASKSKTNVIEVPRPAAMQSGRKLPVVLGSLLKPGATNLHQASPVHLKTTRASCVNKEFMKIRPPSSSNKNNLLLPTYVMDCPASTLFGNPASQGTTSIKSTSLITTVPLHPSNPSVPSNSRAKVPLSKVYAALKSLSAQVKSTGQKLNGTQFVMIENNKTSVLLKVRHEALLPENLNALHKAVLANSPGKQTILPTCVSTNKSTSTPTNINSTVASSAVTIHHSVAKTLSSSSSGVKTLSSTSVLNQKSPSSILSQRLQQKQTSLPVSSSTSSSLENILNQQSHISGTYPTSSSVRGRSISLLLTSNQSGVQPSPLVTVRPPQSTSSASSAYNDTRSILTHIPASSALLPERKKRPCESLSAEQRAAKRRRLEEKYPLPPGVVIKSEPDISEYDIDNNWSVTSEIHTGFINSSELAEITTGRTREDTSDVTTEKDTSHQTHISSHTEKQPLENVDTDSVAMVEEDTVSNDSPPPLDAHSNTMEIGSEDCPEVIEDDAPPVLQPMPPLASSSVGLLALRESSGSKAVFTEQRQGKSAKVLGSSQTKTKIYDSGYDTPVSASSSAESLAFSQTLGKPAMPSAKSKIQQLKELLKQKELQVENMRKKRSQMPEVDLNSL